jgi:hypothetical protein
LLVALAGQECVQNLTPMDWEEAGTKVFMPRWEACATKFSRDLSGMKPESLPEVAGDIAVYSGRFGKTIDQSLSAEDGRNLVEFVAGSALAVTLARAGNAVQCTLGAPVTFHKGELSLDPFTVVPRLAAGELPPEAWRQQCAEWGITGADLGAVGSETTE